MSETRPPIYEFDQFRVDVAGRLFTKLGEQISLTPKVFDTLVYLLRNSGKVIGKDELMREIWIDSIVEENNLNQNISILRKIFGEKPGEQRFIVTVAGHGYRFVPEVRSISDAVNVAPLDLRKESQPSANRNALKGLFLLLGLALAAAFLVYFAKNSTSDTGRVQTIAVLPFKPLVVENRNEALELGLADTLISRLSGREEVIVLPLSSIRGFTSVDQDARKVGEELDVDSVLDGTIQNWGDRIRISAKLIRTTDGKQLWADQFDEKFTDIFTVQDSIAERVASALRIRLVGNTSTRNIEAYQLYMQGRYLAAKGTPIDLLNSISYFHRAIDIDPTYALAYTGIAQAYGVLGITGEMAASEAFPKARSAEEQALRIDESLGEAHIAMCMGLFWYDWDWQAAERECRRGIEIDPNNADFHGYLAQVLSSTGRHEEALAEARRSRELNPLNLAQNAFEGQHLLHAGKTDEALTTLRKISELEPGFGLPHLFAASAYIEKGMFPEAMAESRKEMELTGRTDIPFGVYAQAKSGDGVGARAALEAALKLSSEKYVSPYNIALMYNGLDEPEHALDWLEKGYELRDPKMTFLKVEPKWKALRSNVRFANLMRRMNFN